MTENEPLRVRAWRNPNIENEHLVDAVVCSTSGPTMVWGDSNRPVMARSSIKPLQTMPLLNTGAAEIYKLTDEQLALATASHSGEANHLAAVEAWLAAIGMTPENLECGPASPIGPATALEVGPRFTKLHNCCSGKHAGFLTLARHLGVDPVGYLAPEHPVQQEVNKAIEAFTDFDLKSVSPGVDGCGIPTYPIPLTNLALSMARLVNPVGHVASEYVAGAQRLTNALAKNPWWISGTGRHEVLLHNDATEPLVSKTGADGVFMAALPQQGLGIALKVRDGAKRASDAAITHLLNELGAIKANESEISITNAAGAEVGKVTVA